MSDNIYTPNTHVWSEVAWGKAALFAFSVILIGLVVLPTRAAYQAGLNVEGFVAARTVWGFITATILSVCFGYGRELVTFDRTQIKSSLYRGMGIGFFTLFAYAMALENAHATPVILTVVGVSALVGMLLDRPVNILVWFIPLSLLTTLGAAIIAYEGVGNISTIALAFAIAAGIVYGALPVLVRDSCNKGPASVAHYLIIASLIAIAWALWAASGDFSIVITQITDPAAISAGVICTGLPYVLMQHALRMEINRPSLPTSWATQLYGFEPLAVMAVATLYMNEPLPVAALMFGLAFMLQSIFAGPLYSQTNNPH